MDIVYLNGKYIEKKNATVSIMDRGFLFGDSVYEVIPAYNNKLVGGEEHFARLQQSLAAICMDTPFENFTALKTIAHALLTKNQLTSTYCGLYIQITRGEEEHRNHRIPEALPLTVVMFCMPATLKTHSELSKGFKAITHHDTRREENFIKSTALVSNVMLLHKAREVGAVETILLRNNEVLECTASNLFIVSDGILMTPPLSEFILAGVTRSLILKFANDNDIKTKECIITEDMLNNADEIWVTGSIKEIYPIITLNNHSVGDGKVGPAWQTLYKLYQTYKEVIT